MASGGMSRLIPVEREGRVAVGQLIDSISEIQVKVGGEGREARGGG